MIIVCAAVLSFLLDLLLGDPAGIPHPVVLMGKIISLAEKRMRKRPDLTPQKERRAGMILALCLPAGTFLVTAAAIAGLWALHPVFGFTLNVFWGWQALALRGLHKESRNVRKKLESDTLENARGAVGRIVGRDTERLDRSGIVRAAVETVAENFSDGVTAPLFYLVLGGAPLALCYKAVNTMDSMIGYRNERYLHFGRAAAKLDDAVNFIPARMSALLLITAAFFCGQNAKDAARIWKRDRRKHASPNSAQTESVMAGALGIRLAGPAWYFGEYHEKPCLGDGTREPEPRDIDRAGRMLYAGSVLGLILLCAVRAGCVLLFRMM